jgi:hypothetical protein
MTRKMNFLVALALAQALVGAAMAQQETGPARAASAESERVREPVLAQAPALPPSGTHSRSTVVAEEARQDYAGAAAREMFNLASTVAMEPRPMQVAGQPALLYHTDLPARDGVAASPVAIVFVFDAEATHIFWARRPPGTADEYPADLDRLLRAYRPR